MGGGEERGGSEKRRKTGGQEDGPVDDSGDRWCISRRTSVRYKWAGHATCVQSSWRLCGRSGSERRGNGDAVRSGADEGRWEEEETVRETGRERQRCRAITHPKKRGHGWPDLPVRRRGAQRLSARCGRRKWWQRKRTEARGQHGGRWQQPGATRTACWAARQERHWPRRSLRSRGQRWAAHSSQLAARAQPEPVALGPPRLSPDPASLRSSHSLFMRDPLSARSLPPPSLSAILSLVRIHPPPLFSRLLVLVAIALVLHLSAAAPPQCGPPRVRSRPVMW